MDVKEDYENSIVWVTISKRDKRIKIFVPRFGRYPYWHITYEDGQNIAGLEGVYITSREALRAVTFWEQETKESNKVYLDRVFGPADPPQLKRKKVKRSDTIVTAKAS